MLQQLMGNMFGGGRRSNGGIPAGMRATNSYVSVTDGDAAYNTAAEVAAIIQANTANAAFTLIWEKTIPAGALYAWGHGNPNQQRNQGYLWFVALDTNIDFEEGVLRLQIANSRDTRVEYVQEFDTRRTHLTTVTTVVTARPTDINTMLPVPFTGDWVKEDSKLQLWFKTQEAGTTVDTVGFSIPVTILQ